MRKDDVVADTLTEGQKLAKGESITSNNGAYKLILQDDGNLVLYARDHVVWATGTDGQNVVRAEVQTDGNFVLYTPDKPVWASQTKGKKDVKLVIQDDRNLVLYAKGDDAVWSSKTDTKERRLQRRGPPPQDPIRDGEDVQCRPTAGKAMRTRASRKRRRQLNRQRLPLPRRPSRRHPHRRGHTPWCPGIRCGRFQNGSTATVTSTSGSRTPVASATLT